MDGFRKFGILVVVLFWTGLGPISVLAQQLDGRSPLRAGAVVRRERANLDLFDVVWESVRRNYHDPRLNGVNWSESREKYRPLASRAVDDEELYSILNRMLAELKDRHTFAKSPSAVRAEEARSRIGIGFSVKGIEGRYVVTQVVGGSAAQGAGIKPGWILVERDGAPFDVARSYPSEIGQTVRFKFLDREDRVRRVAVACRPFAVVPEQNSRRLKNGILYVRLSEFGPESGKWFKAVLARNRQSPAAIIDLRGNGGGVLQALEDSLECLFAEERPLGRFLQRTGKPVELRVRGTAGEAFSGGIVVLIDEDSASASEMFASAVKETGRGRIVGRLSAGSVLAGVEESLPDGGKLQVSIRDFISARGTRLEGTGVAPDDPVTPTLEDLRANIDRDVERAVRILQ